MKKFIAKENMGFGSGTPIFYESIFRLSTIVIAMLIGPGFFFGFLVWLQRK